MNVFRSEVTRHLVVRINRGESLIEALHELCSRESVSAATVAGHGLLESVRLDVFDARSRTYSDARGFVGAIELLSIQGHLSIGEREREPDVHVHVTIARDTDNGLQVLGGRLLDASAIAVELTVAVHEGIALVRIPEKDAGLLSWHSVASPSRAEPRRASREAPPEPQPEVTRERPARASIPAPSRPTLAEVARQLEAMPERHDRGATLDEEVALEKGDVLIHPTWGETEVIREDEPGQFVIRLARSGAFKTIRIDIFELSLRGARGSRSVYDLKNRARGG